MRSESSIQKAILKILNARDDVWAVKTITTNRNGTPDIIACVGGHFVAIEVKAERGVVAPLQTHQINLINQAGGTAGVARTTQEVKDMLDTLQKMALHDGDFKVLDAVDPAVKDKLLELQEIIETARRDLEILLNEDEITSDDIKAIVARL